MDKQLDTIKTRIRSCGRTSNKTPLLIVGFTNELRCYQIVYLITQTIIDGYEVRGEINIIKLLKWLESKNTRSSSII